MPKRSKPASKETKRYTDPLSVNIVSSVVVLYLAVVATLTVWTHAAQLAGSSFRIYAFVSVALTIIVAGLVILLGRARITASAPRDTVNLLLLIGVALISIFLSVSRHRIGRISPDEYYYSANAVYYVQHPDAALGFESRNFYSREPIYSASYYTAGAYEYIQAAFAFLTRMPFARFYYLIGAGMTGFLIAASLFLLLHRLSGDAGASIFGTVITLSGLAIMGETAWAPGANSFLRAFEGKALLQFAAVPLLAAFSIAYFERRDRRSWVGLFLLCIAMAGASTSSFAILPSLGLILLIAYAIAFRDSLPQGRALFLPLVAYAAAFIYLGVAAAFVAQHDGVSNAALLNSDYPATFAEYLSGFIYAPFPITPALAVLASISAVILTRGKVRTFLILWMALAVLLVLNPWSAGFLLQYVRGIYYRLFYVFPFPLAIGLAAACVYILMAARAQGSCRGLTIASLAVAAVLPALLPGSIFRAETYAWGNALTDTDMQRAADIVSATPAGVMLAPYPLSGAVAMFDSDRPQMLARPDMLAFYLGQQHADRDAALRAGAQRVLESSSTDVDAIAELLDAYPEIVSLALNRQAYLAIEDRLRQVLEDRGFIRRKTFIEGTVVFSR